MTNEFKTRNGIITPYLRSTVQTGTAPLTVESSTLVNNLNSQYLNGQDGSYYLSLDNATGTLDASKLTGSLPSSMLGNTISFIGTGTGLSGGPITTSGTISLADTTVTPGSYTTANITVDAQGRITAASNGSGGGSSGFEQSFLLMGA